jgi:hypothetical protein
VSAKAYSLCPDCEHCPSVEITSDGKVSIGEAPNLVTLRASEWNELVRAVKSGRLAEVG